MSSTADVLSAVKLVEVAHNTTPWASGPASVPSGYLTITHPSALTVVGNLGSWCVSALKMEEPDGTPQYGPGALICCGGHVHREARVRNRPGGIRSPLPCGAVISPVVISTTLLRSYCD
jgi:hypothetical protein